MKEQSGRDSLSDNRLPAFTRALLEVDRVASQRILLESDPSGGPMERIERLIVPALVSIGNGWDDGSVSLSQVYMAGRLCETLVDAILPAADPQRRRNPIMAIAVLEDYHMLGLRIVYAALRASGFELANYGRLSVDEVTARVKADGVAFLLLSVLMLPSALQIKEVTARLRAESPATKVIVGGAPFRFDPNLAAEVGADAVGDSAGEAVAIVRRFMEVRP